MLSFSVYFEPHLRRPVSQPSPAPFLGFPNLLTFKPSNVQTFRSFPPSLSSHQISAARLFSFTYEFPIFYPLCFDIHACNGGGCTPLPAFQLANVPTFKPSNDPCLLFSYRYALFRAMGAGQPLWNQHLRISNPRPSHLLLRNPKTRASAAPASSSSKPSPSFSVPAISTSSPSRRSPTPPE